MKVLPIATLVEKIATGEITSYEVVSHYLEVIKEKNGEINAIVTINENALKEAKKADEAIKNGKTLGPLHGIPFTCKDSFKTVGVRTTSGSKKLKDYIPQKDAEIVKQLKAFGAILLAKTNLPELAQDLQTENHLFGKTNNPHNRNYTSGGSSGGEAAAVASGMSLLGIGSDIGGSVRVPAHYCGVAAIKPTEYLLSTEGHIPPLPNSGMTIDYLIHSGIIAKNSSDLHYVLTTIKGTKPQAPIGAFRKSKILWSDTFAMLPITDKTKEAIKELIIKLDSASFEVEEYYFSKNTCEYMWRTYGELFGHLLQPMLPLPLRVLFRYIGKFIGKDIISKATFSKLIVGEKSYEKVLQQREEAIAIIDTLFNNHDVFICPVSSSPAFKHRKIGQIHTSVDVDGAMIPGNIAGIGYTAIFNLTGHPTVVIPVTKSDNGLPIGLQIVGKRGEDDKLLMICEQIEQYIDI